MAVQLPPEALGSAVGILVYSIICLICGLFLLWLIWAHNERTSYVAMLSFFVSLNCLASIIQQIHTMVAWNDVKTGQYQYLKDKAGNAEIAIAGASQGLDLVLFYIQFYTYNVDAMIVLLWALELTLSVYHVRKLRHNGPYTTAVIKLTAVLLPLIQVGLLRVPAIQKSTGPYLFVANVILAVSVTGGCILLLCILFKYIQTRRAFLSWDVRYGDKSGSSRGTNVHNSQHGTHAPTRNIYDRWLVIRFTVAFFALLIFEMFTVYFQILSASKIKRQNIPSEPDLSAARARGDFALFIPGVSEGLLAFLVFGTTRTFRDYTLKLIVPNHLWARRQARKCPPTPSAQEHLRTESSRDYLRSYDAEPGHSTPTNGMYEDGMDLHSMDGVQGHRQKGSRAADELPIIKGVVEPSKTWYRP